MSSPTSEPQSTHRRLPDPGLLFAVGLAAVVLAVGLSVLVPYRRQQSGIEFLEQIGGLVVTEPVGPEWLRNIVGDGRMRGLDDVIRVSLHDYPINDDDLKVLTGWTSLQGLNLDSTQITDEGLKFVSGLTSLESLNLDGTQITDEGLKFVSGLTSLQTLYLSGTQVTDEGLKHLTGLSSLKWLSLNGTQITDEGAGELRKHLPYCDVRL